MNEKQQQLTFDKGISNKPSDILCDDNCLQDSMNIVYRDGEHQPIQEPVRFLEIATHNDVSIKEVVFIHKVDNMQRYIVLLDDNSLGWGVRKGWTVSTDSSNEPSEVSEQATGTILSSDEDYYYEAKGILVENVSDVSIQAIGKTLVVNVIDATTREGSLNYYLWEQNVYTSLGNSIPEPEEIEFETYSPDPTVAWTDDIGRWDFVRTETLWRVEEGTDWIKNGTDWCIGHGSSNSQHWIEGEHAQDFNNFVIAQFNEARNHMHAVNVFTDPFMVRFAVELVDGTYRNISAPIMMFPVVHHNTFMLLQWEPTADYDGAPRDAYVWVKGGKLRFKAKYDFTDYQDLVRGVSVFVSRMVPITYWDEAAGLKPRMDAYAYTSEQPDYISDGVYKKMPAYSIEEHSTTDWSHTSLYINFYSRSEKWIRDELLKQENFYKLADLGLTQNTDGFVDLEIPENRLRNIEQATKLDDNLYERHNRTGNSIFAYNNRLIVGALKQYFFKGDKNFIGYTNGVSPTEYDVYVEIRTNSGVKTIHGKLNTNQQLQYFYYYPDPRARRVKIYRGDDTLIVDQQLKESETWHGAYFFAGLPSRTYNSELEIWEEAVSELNKQETQPDPSTIDDSPEILDNQLSVSEVDNPWVFMESGMLTAGTGAVIGFSTYTTALSQGQFGQYPLLIFTTDGVYAASMNAEGVFTAVHPMSREVCNNPDSITQTDGAVFFSSAKGLMMAVGGEVRCVSEQLSGDFPNILKTAKIAYDYRDSLLWIMPKGISENYIYSIKTGTMHTCNYFYNIDEEVSKTKAGIRRAPSMLPSLGNTYQRFNGFVNVNEENVEEGRFDDDALHDDVAKKVVQDAEITSWGIDDIPHLVLPAVKNAAIDIYQKYKLWYSIDRGSTQYDTKYRMLPDKVEEGDIVSCGDIVYKWLSQQMVEIAASSLVVFEGVINGTDLMRESDKFDLSELEEKVKELHSDAVINRTFLDVYFDSSEDMNKFVLGVLAYYKYKDPNDSSKFVTDAYQKYYSDWDAIPEYGVLAPSGNYVDGQGDVPTDKYYYYFDDNGKRRMYSWGSVEETLVRLDNTDVDNISETIDESKVIDSEPNYETWLNECLAAWKSSKEQSGADITNWHVASGEVVFNKGVTPKAFIERRTYSYLWNNKMYTGSAYYADFENKGDYMPMDVRKVYISGSAYYKWDATEEDLVLWKAALTGIVNNYPDTMFFKQGDGLYSLLNRPQPEDDTNQYDGVIETRPMKLENGLALKSIMQVRHIKCMDGTMTMQIFASNNLKEWVELHSLRGIPWLYYKFRFTFSDMRATDRYAGTMLITQERRTNKMR